MKFIRGKLVQFPSLYSSWRGVAQYSYPWCSQSVPYLPQSPFIFQKRFWLHISFSFPSSSLSVSKSACKAFPSSFISLNCAMSFCSIDLFNDKECLDKFHLDNLDLKDFLKYFREAKERELAMMLVAIGRGKSRRRANCAIFLSYFLSLFHCDVLVCLMEMETELVSQVPRFGIAMALCRHKHECLYHMFHLLFIDNNVSIGLRMGLATPKRYGRQVLVNPLWSQRCRD